MVNNQSPVILMCLKADPDAVLGLPQITSWSVTYSRSNDRRLWRGAGVTICILSMGNTREVGELSQSNTAKEGTESGPTAESSLKACYFKKNHTSHLQNTQMKQSRTIAAEPGRTTLSEVRVVSWAGGLVGDFSFRCSDFPFILFRSS